MFEAEDVNILRIIMLIDIYIDLKSCVCLNVVLSDQTHMLAVSFPVSLRANRNLFPGFGVKSTTGGHFKVVSFHGQCLGAQNCCVGAQC